MKKIIIFFAIVVMIVCTITFQINSKIQEKNQIESENYEFSQYFDKEIYGIDLASIINKAVDTNIKNKVEKNEQGYFINNDKNSIQIEIYLSESETTYKMEQIYKQGTEKFVQFFINAKFKCSKKESHQNTGRIKYMFFEQI